MATKAAQFPGDDLWKPEWKPSFGEETIQRRSASKDSRFTFYSAWFCPFAQRAWIVAEECNVPYQWVEINTYEVNRNLLLNDGPRADSVPNLELETGDVEGAGHASATGRFDEQQLFYLMSRGIPEGIARQLVVRGFFADVLGRLGMADLQADIVERIAARLGLDSGLDVQVSEVESE